MSRRSSKRGRSLVELEAEEGPKRNKAAEAGRSKRSAKSEAGPRTEDSASKRQKQRLVEAEHQQDDSQAEVEAFINSSSKNSGVKDVKGAGAASEQIQDFIHAVHQSPPSKHRSGSNNISGSTRRYTSSISTVTPPSLHTEAHEPWVGRSTTSSFVASPLIDKRSPRRQSPRKSPRRRQAEMETQAARDSTLTTDRFALLAFVVCLVVVGYNLLQLQDMMHARRGHGQFAETTYVTGLLTNLLWEPVYAEQHHHLPMLQTLEELVEPQYLVQMFLIPGLCGVAGFAAVSILGVAMLAPIVFLLSYLPLVIIVAVAGLCLAWQHYLLAAAAGFALAVYWMILPTIRKTVGHSMSLWHEAVSSRYLSAYPLHLFHVLATDAFVFWLVWSGKEVLSVIAINAIQPKSGRHSNAEMTKALIAVVLMAMWVHFSFRGCAQIAIARSTRVMQQETNRSPIGSLMHTYRYHLGSACFGGLFMTTAATIRFIRTTTDLSRQKLQKVAALIPWWMVPALPIKLAINVTAALLWTIVQLLSAFGFYLERFVPLRYAYVGVHGVPLLYHQHDTSIGSPVMTMSFTQDMLMIAITVLATTVGQMFLGTVLFGQVIRRVQMYSVLYAVYLCAFVTRATMLALLAIKPPQNMEPIDHLMNEILKQ